MIYLLNKLDLSLFQWCGGQYLHLHLFKTGESKVKGWILNERTRTIIEKQEVVNLFNIKEKIQMAQVNKIVLNKFDKIIVWTPDGQYYAFRVIGVEKGCYGKAISLAR